jgi:hypothetical protein
MDEGPASQLIQDGEVIKLHQQVQQQNHQQVQHQHPMRSEELVILDENLLHSPFGSTNPYQFYHVLNVEINASLPQIEAAYKNLSLLYHPDRHDTTKTPGQLNFRSSRPSKARSQTLRNDKNTTVNPGGPLRMPSASVDVP